MAVDAEPRSLSPTGRDGQSPASDVAKMVTAWAATRCSGAASQRACIVYVAAKSSGVVQEVRTKLPKTVGECSLRVIGVQQWWDDHPGLKKQV